MPSQVKGNLKEFVVRFEELIESFYKKHEQPRWSSDNFRQGPCLHFHRASIECVRRESRPFSEWLPKDHYAHEMFYAMLTAWGMNQGGAKLRDFLDFKRAVSFLASLEALEKCRSIRLEDLTHAKQPLLERLFEALDDPDQAKVMASGPSVIGGSKLLHHLLPDLIPPMDREYTEGSLNWFDDENKLEGALDSFNGIWHVLMFFRKVALEVGSERIRKQWLDDTKYPMNTSIPKIIDNALIAYSWTLWPNG